MELQDEWWPVYSQIVEFVCVCAAVPLPACRLETGKLGTERGVKLRVEAATKGHQIPKRMGECGFFWL